ncbi:MAG: hypothetical protein ABEJ55_05430 [Halanaeroarchaeum sp.]
MDNGVNEPAYVERSVLVTRPGRPGDSVLKVARVEGEDGSDAFALLSGEVKRETTLAGDEVLIEDIPTRVDLGSAETVDRLVDALETLTERDDG